MPDEKSSRLKAKANKLYWGTSRPAGHLADELGISRSKFYALIEPLRLDLVCEACGTALAFTSRTDREAGRGRCPECGAVAEIAAAEPPAALAAEEPPEAAYETSIGSWLALPGSRELWLIALAGVAAGLLVSVLVRRR